MVCGEGEALYPSSIRARFCTLQAILKASCARACQATSRMTTHTNELIRVPHLHHALCAGARFLIDRHRGGLYANEQVCHFIASSFGAG